MITQQPPTENEAPDNRDVEMVDLGDTDDISGEEDTPPLLSYVSRWRFWWKCARWPLLFLAVHAVAFIMIDLIFEEHLNQQNHRTGNHDNGPPKVLVIVLFLIASVLLLIDAIFLLRAARHVEKEVKEMTEQAYSESSLWSPVHVHAKVSKQLDSFLSQGQGGPKVTFLVNFLFALCALTMVATAISFTSLAFVVSGKGQQLCFHSNPGKGDSTLPPTIQGVPSELQEWAHNGGEQSSRRNEAYGSYVHLSNGWTFFSGITTVEEGEEHYLISLVSTSPTGDLQSYPDVLQPIDFYTIGNNQTGLPTSFCCLYTPKAERDNWNGGATRSTGILCSYNSSVRNATWMYPHVKHEGQHYDIIHLDMIYLDDLLWLRAQKEEYGSRKSVIAIDTLNLETMNISKVATVYDGLDDAVMENFPDEKCREAMLWIDILVGLIVTVVSTAWLFRVKKLPSSVVPLCVLANVTLWNLNRNFGLTAVVLGALIATFVVVANPLMPKEHREMVLWAVYTLLIVLFVTNLTGNSGDGDDMFYIVVVCVFIGFLLNHPLLQLFAWIGAIVTVFVFFIAVIVSDTGTLFMVIPVCIVTSCGLATLGYQLAKYRTYLVVYSRRLWRAMVALEARAARRNTSGRDDTSLRQGLLQNQDRH
mmetsp:Transcript_30019/g.49584  ORF Transcript_30019/g.49584 Transcript_30019/m.49584 type:complete len:645 (+) Transcript_30019:315-2249(+)